MGRLLGAQYRVGRTPLQHVGLNGDVAVVRSLRRGERGAPMT
jgi:hypothetical protein